MKLSKWAKSQGICYMTAFRWFHAGKLPVKAYQTETGTIIVDENSLKYEDDKKEKSGNRTSENQK